MRRTLPILLIALAVGLIVLSSGAAAATVWRTWDAGLREAGESGRPVLVDVYTDWCRWCKQMDRDVYSRRDVQQYLESRFVTVRLNAEANDAARYEGRPFTSRTLAARFGVTGYPTTIFLDASGSHLGNVPGYLPPDRFLLLLRYVGDGYLSRGVSFDDFQRQAQPATPLRRAR